MVNSFILGRPEPQETNRHQPNLEEIHRLRNLNLNDQIPIEKMLTEPYNYCQRFDDPHLSHVYPELYRTPLRLNENTENVVCPSYQPQKLQLPSRLEEDPIFSSPDLALRIREGFQFSSYKDHGAVKKNLPRPRSKSNRNLEVQNGVQAANLRRSLSNPHNPTYLHLTGMFQSPQPEILRMEPPFPAQEPVFYPCLKTTTEIHYNQDLMPDKNVKQYRTSYPPDPYATHHLQPPVPNGRLEPQKVSILLGCV